MTKCNEESEKHLEIELTHEDLKVFVDSVGAVARYAETAHQFGHNLLAIFERKK